MPAGKPHSFAVGSLHDRCFNSDIAKSFEIPKKQPKPKKIPKKKELKKVFNNLRTKEL
ncbi:MAG: hypothetical protein BTN85_0262 [Candidatus Methanohalarchaeum thermophilum]|uniref:Uncharacterized protein n=1 Tax=Methanohalarchaeum thermophilum TaxID=1903181 RepID=A0A1Q6DTV0_METT1|nr:MAG: hypothetical protein BTN85_0262 [Candidatus Methanohalarchaeum thermophilum]